MLFKFAVILFAAWLAGLAGVYTIGDGVHVLLLVSLMFGLISFLQARDAARRVVGPPDRG